jgi:signal transduction histidine kinase
MDSLRLRLLIAITLVAAIALVAVGLFSTQNTQVEFQRLQRPASVAVPPDALSRIQRWYDDHHSWSRVEPALQQQDAQLFLFTMGRRFVAASNSAVRDASLSPGNPPTLRARVMQAGPLSQEEQLVLHDPPSAVIRDRAGVAVGMIYAAPLPDLHAQNPVAMLTKRLWLAILCALLAAVFAAWLLARQILAPITALSDATTAMQAGDLSRRIPVEGPKEIAQLAQRFNALSEHLARSEALRKRMISDIAHELRSPLTNIRGIVEAIEDGHLPPDASSLRSLGEETTSLAHLVNDLQDLSLADAGQLKVQMNDVAIDECVRGVVESFSSVARMENVDIQVRSQGAVRVPADAARLRQVVGNLLTNAIRVAPAQSRIRISIDGGENDVRVSVRDEGPGVPEGELDAIFERFYRTDESRSRARGGAGLGLAIVKQLVRAHGGSARAVNNAERGATFSFTLPKRSC